MHHLDISDKERSKKVKYQTLLPQLNALVEGESDLIANISNIVAALKYAMNFFWVGVYFVKENQLVLGPFQGPVACTRIQFGKGVCGTSWQQKAIVNVPNVDEFPGHIACNANSKSEIVLPVFRNKEVFMVLDIDSDRIGAFDVEDEKYLLEVVQIMERL